MQGAYGSQTPYNGSIGFLQTSLANPALRWEKTNTTEAGADMGFFGNQLNVSLAYYNRITEDKPAYINLPTSSGVSSIRTNNGSMRNRGFELDLGYQILKEKAVTWQVNANAEGGDPSPYIKSIRDRAYANADPTPFVNGSQDANELAIFAERSKEFVYEGKRWYDIRRMKFGGEPLVFISSNHPYGVLDKGTQAYKILWPIETATWTNDSLVDQTPGYTTSKPK